MSITEQAKRFVGHDNWTTYDGEIPSFRVADGPNGLRIETKTGLGFNESAKAVAYPTSSALGCSFDEQLMYEMGTALAQECLSQGVGILLGPGINHKRSPLCGRNFEYFSEDPVLSGKLGSAWVAGLQDHGVGASLKHFAGNSREKGRLRQDSIIDERALNEIYLKAFEMVIRNEQPWTVMTAYNMLNGQYCSENAWLMKEKARREWGFQGMFISDWGAVSDPVRSIQNGLNLEMPGGDHGTSRCILRAVEKGELSEQQLEESDQWFRKTEGKIYRGKRIPFDLETHLRVAQKASEMSSVLLKNEGLLPINKKTHYAVIGDFAKRPRSQGAGSSKVNPIREDNLYDCMNREGYEIRYAKGYSENSDNESRILEAEAVELARNSEVVILVVGNNEGHEAEGYDRKDMKMPENQLELIQKILQVNRNVIVVLQCGAPIELPWIDEVNAVLLMYLSGCQGGQACLNLLNGTVNPSGKLAETFPLKIEDTPCYKYFDDELVQVQYRESIFTGYRYYNTFGIPVRFPFGYGLSYTTFRYDRLSIKKTDTGIDIAFTVTNTGKCRGREVPLIFSGMEKSRIARPSVELRGFTSVILEPHETKRLHMSFKTEEFSYYDTSEHKWMVEQGEYQIYVGHNSADLSLCGSVILEGTCQPYSSIPAEVFFYEKGIPCVSDSVFEKELGRKIPEKLPSYPYTRDTTIQELNQTGIGRFINRRVRRMLKKNMISGGNDTMVYEAPIRMALMVSDKVTYDTVDALVDFLNRKGSLLKLIKTLL